MKKLNPVYLSIFVITFLFVSQNAIAQTCSKVCTPPPAIDAASLVGDWSGTCTFEGKTYDVRMNFQMVEGNLAANASLPGLDLPQTEYKTWICRSNDVHLSLNLPNGKVVKFIGRPENGELTGRFVYNEANVCSPARESFSLRRIGV